MSYRGRHKYSQAELADMALDDLRRDIYAAERQAEHGPFYPERGITRESLLEYAQKLRQEIRDLGGTA